MSSKYETDVISTSAGNLSISFLGHGSLLMVFKGMKIYLDPFGKVADYSTLPKADIILITHEHADHFDQNAISLITTDKTILVVTEICAHQVNRGIIMHNGDRKTLSDILIEAVPAYNLVHLRPNGEPFHPRGFGNGYVLSFGETRLYFAGDTENIPEMEKLNKIDIAFLPMNLPYTMTPEMVTEAAKVFRPRILYPYHYGDTDVSRLVEFLKKETEIEVRIRKMS